MEVGWPPDRNLFLLAAARVRLDVLELDLIEKENAAGTGGDVKNLANLDCYFKQIANTAKKLDMIF